MSTIALLIACPYERAKLADALTNLTGPGKVQPCAHVGELTTLVAAGGVSVVVSELRDTRGARTEQALLMLQRRDTTLPIIIPVELSPAAMKDVVRANGAGLMASCVLRGFESLVTVVARTVENDVQTGPAMAVLRPALPVVPSEMSTFISAAAIRAVRPITVAGVAEALHTSERTLVRRVRGAGLPPPHRVLGWCRMLYAAWYLDTLEHPPKQVVNGLRFPSLPALYNLFQHYGAPTPATLREHGGFSKLLSRFTEELRAAADR